MFIQGRLRQDTGIPLWHSHRETLISHLSSPRKHKPPLPWWTFYTLSSGSLAPGTSRDQKCPFVFPSEKLTSLAHARESLLTRRQLIMSLLFTPYVEFFIESFTSRRNADKFCVNLPRSQAKAVLGRPIEGKKHPSITYCRYLVVRRKTQKPCHAFL